jgi:hypothetical protein
VAALSQPLRGLRVIAARLPRTRTTLRRTCRYFTPLFGSQDPCCLRM